MTGKRDLVFEALIEHTGATMSERGQINKAAKMIRDAMAGVDDDELAREIEFRARLYRRVMPDVVLTPLALAKHWQRVLEENAAKEARGTNQAANKLCETCHGDRFVFVGWREGDMFEVYAPCPDCNPIEVSFRRYDGSWFRSMDPARAREVMAG